MSYNMSQLDKDNLSWFKADRGKNTLLKLSVSNGSIRCLKSVEIEFAYPITAIVGENGAGKSTFLALIACAFHNDSTFLPLSRQESRKKKARHYYTYGDFFAFSPSEVGISNVEIKSCYLTNEGPKEDTRKKKASGKWNDYNRRPKRVVTYLGINRVVPPSESSSHRNHRREFLTQRLTPIEQKQMKDAVSAVLGRPYATISMGVHKTDRLFGTKRGSISYSGFNMGAGENACIGLIYEVICAGKGALIVVDEIELGLHIQAQIKLVNELKKICKTNHCQIVFSTHSKDVLDCLPPEGRIFVGRSDSKTEIIQGVSSELAFGKLSGKSSNELHVFVEDKVAKAFIETVVPKNIRERIHVVPIGQADAIYRQMAAYYREGKENFVAFLDGDQRTTKASGHSKIKNELGDKWTRSQEEFETFIEPRLNYIPGDKWPEYEVVNSLLLLNNFDDLVDQWGADDAENVKQAFELGFSAEEHKEFFAIGESVFLEESRVRTDCINLYKKLCPEKIGPIIDSIARLLP